MRFLVAAQLPPSLARFLTMVDEEAIACRDVGLRDADDGEIWRFAIAGGWCIVTEDEDFAVRHMTESGGTQVVWLRIGNSTNLALFSGWSPSGQKSFANSGWGKGWLKWASGRSTGVKAAHVTAHQPLHQPRWYARFRGARTAGRGPYGRPEDRQDHEGQSRGFGEGPRSLGREGSCRQSSRPSRGAGWPRESLQGRDGVTAATFET